MTLNLVNVIDQCDDGKPVERDHKGIDTIAVHRIGKSLGEDAVTICRRFIDDPAVAKYTGAEVPYTFIIGIKGRLWQCLPVSEIGAHARRWNAQAIGVACIGDFRKHEMPPIQFDKLIRLSAALQYAWPNVLQVKGHDELPGGSSDPNKRCPGDKLDMDHVRRLVASGSFLQRLSEMGIEP